MDYIDALEKNLGKKRNKFFTITAGDVEELIQITFIKIPLQTNNFCNRWCVKFCQMV